MPASETICISYGNWIAAFPAVYALAAVALVATAAVLVDWTLSKVRASRLGSTAGSIHGVRIAQSRA